MLRRGERGGLGSEVEVGWEVETASSRSGASEQGWRTYREGL